MKKMMAAMMCGSLIVGAQAQGGGTDAAARPTAAEAREVADWGDWTRPLGDPAATPSRQPVQEPASEEIDVVDAHWMALTMWGEARSQGEEGMRAVGHVIHNRWRSRGRYGAYVTDTVSQAWQFSCWNPGDPNRQAMLNVDLLPADSDEHRLWLVAKRVAGEILSGQSPDPTSGALFYHTTAVQPAWSRGVAPVTHIGSHLFFTQAR